MGTSPRRSFSIWGTMLIGLFLLLSGAGFAFAQEELADPTPELFTGEIAEETTEEVPEEEATERLIETSQRLAELNEIEENKPPSAISVSVDAVKNISVQLGVFGFLLLLLLVNVAFLYRNGSPYAKKLIFALMVLVITIPTLYFIASTIYVNIISVTKGPVHWHADFEIYACGEELPPPEPPHRLSNKTGTPVLHQHEDKRLHVEGVVVDLSDVSLRSFFAVQGGELSNRSIKVPTGTGFATYTNGDSCGDGVPGVWSVFLYKVNTDTETISKTKLTDFADHVLSPYIEVPPGDCLIFNFGENIEDTEHICDFYQIEINKGNLTPLWSQP